MEESIFKYLLDYGSLGITAGLLFWLFLQNSKTIKEIREQARQDEEKIRNRYDTDLSQIRDRYDAVIAKYDQEKTMFFDERTKLHSQLVAQIEQLEKTVERQDQQIQAIKEKLDALLLLRREAITC
tara:strand:+ start:40 stop:417 length:378 start_codon:yes stop_codon:yes gene_type:complete